MPFDLSASGVGNGYPDWLGKLPVFSPSSQAPPPSGNWLTSGIMSGVHQGLGQVGSTVQAVGTLAQSPNVTAWGQSLADSQAKAAAPYARPDLDQLPWYSPTRNLYGLAQAIPSAAIGIGGSALGGAVAGAMAGPEAAPFGALAGAGLAMSPFVIGQNVEAAKGANGGALSQRGAALSLGLGIPESVAFGLPESVLAGRIPGAFADAAARRFGTGLGGRVAAGAAGAAAYQAPLAMAQTAITQQAFTPDMPVVDRAKQIVSSAFSGGLQGAVFGGALGAFRHSPVPQGNPADTTNADMAATVDAATGQSPEPAGPQKLLPPPNAMGTAALPAPDFAGQMDSNLLAQTHADLTARTDLSPIEMAQLQQVQSEVQRRAVPGTKPGDGFTMFSPEEVEARQPGVDTFQQHVLAEIQGIPRVRKAGAADDEFFQNFNAQDTPDLINAIRVGADREKLPGWLKVLGQRYGVLDDGGGVVSSDDATAQAQKTVEDLTGQRAELANDATTAKNDQTRAKIVEKWRGLQPQIEAAQASLADHQEAARRLEAVKPGPTAGAPVGEVPNAAQEPVAQPVGEGASNAIQEPSAEGVLPQPVAEAGGAVGDGHAEGTAPVEEGALREEFNSSTDPDRRVAILDRLQDLAQGPMRDRENRPFQELDPKYSQGPDEPPDVAPGLREWLFGNSPKDAMQLWQADQEGKAVAPWKDPRNANWDEPPEEPQPVGREVTASVVDPNAPVRRQLPVDDRLSELVAQHNFKLEALARIADPTVPQAYKDQMQKAIDLTQGVGGRKDPRAVMNALNAQDTVAAQAKPDGPFQGKDGQVTSTANVPRATTSYVKELMDYMGFGHLRVALIHPDDVTRENGFAGDHADAVRKTAWAMKQAPDANGFTFTFGPDAKDFAMYIRPDLSPALTAETAGWEMGRVINKVAVRNAPPATRAKLQTAFDAFVKQTQGMTQQELVQATRNRAQAAQVLTRVDPKMLANDPANAEYHKKFDQWLANNVSRTLTQSKVEAPRTALQKFFVSVGESMRKLTAYVTGKGYAPDSTVKTFVNGLAKRSSPAMWAGEGDTKPQFSTGASMVDSNKLMKNIVSSVGDVAQRVSSMPAEKLLNATGPVRRTLLGFVSGENFSKFQRAMKSLKPFHDVTVTRSTIEDFKNKANVAAARDFVGLPKKSKIAAQQFLFDLQPAHDAGIDPRKTWADQDPRVLNSPNKNELLAMHQELRSGMDRLRTMGALPAVEKALTGMQTGRWMELAAHLWREQESYTGAPLDGFAQHPDMLFRDNPTAHDDPALANSLYGGWIKGALAGVDKRIAETEAQASQFFRSPAQRDQMMAGKSRPQIAAVRKALDALDQQYNATRSSSEGLRAVSRLVKLGLEQSKNRTYAKLGRGDGDYFASAQMATDADGNVRPETIAAFQKALKDAGLEHIAMFQDSDSSTFMSRLESIGQSDQVAKMLQGLKAQGHLDPNSEVSNGYVNQLDTKMKTAPMYFQRQMQSFDAMTANLRSNAPPEVVNEMRRAFVSQMVNMLPDHSLIRSLQPRRLVSGVDSNMQKAMMQRLRTSARASTSISMSGRIAAAADAIRQEVQDAKSNPKFTSQQKEAMQDVGNEQLRREAEQSWRVSNKFIDGVRAIMHSIVIGANPAYVATVMSQLPLLGQPELAKTHGYANAGVLIGKSTGPALNALLAALRGHEGVSGGFREESLVNGKVAADFRKIILELDADGKLSNSTFTRESTNLGENADPRMEKAKDWLNVLGTSAEMWPRLIMAKAAAAAYDQRAVAGLTRREFIAQVVDNSQFGWGANSGSRNTGKRGPFGGATPLIMAFTRFQGKMIEKLYIETHALIGKDGPQAQKEAGMFLAAHLAAVVAIAGTMGLPFSGAVSGVFDKIAAALTGRDDIDIQGMYRSWLEHTYGFQMGDMIEHGLPRALGVDFSHLGDQHLAPFTALLQDKRKWEDALKDWLKSMGGSALNEASGMYLGGRDMMNGDYLLGASKMLPGGLGDLAEAAYAQKYGYINRGGVPLPTSQINPADIAMIASGLKPADLAKYDEERRTFVGLQAQQQYREQNISRHLTRSVMTGQTEDLPYWQNQSMQYSMQHPGMGSPLMSMMPSLSEHYRQAAEANAMNVPLGLSPIEAMVLRSRLGLVHPEDAQ